MTDNNGTESTMLLSQCHYSTNIRTLAHDSKSIILLAVDDGVFSQVLEGHNGWWKLQCDTMQLLITAKCITFFSIFHRTDLSKLPLEFVHRRVSKNIIMKDI